MTSESKDLRHRTPKETVKAYCVYCNSGKTKEVESCDADGNDPAFRACPFHLYRLGTGRPSVKVIRKFCFQCMGESALLVRECETMECFCHPYRKGKNPARSGKGQTAERMALVRLKKQAVSLKIREQKRRSAVGQG